MPRLTTFQNPEHTKEDLIAELEFHEEAERLIKGMYFGNWHTDDLGDEYPEQMCLIGCAASATARTREERIKLAHTSPTTLRRILEEHYGIPEAVSAFADMIFEHGEENEDKATHTYSSTDFAVKFIENIEEGVDLMEMFYPFLETIFHQFTKVQAETIMETFLQHVKIAKYEGANVRAIWGEEE